MSKRSFVHIHLIKYSLLKKDCLVHSLQWWKRTVVGLIIIISEMLVFQQSILTFTNSLIILHKMFLLKTYMYSTVNNVNSH